jgi:hypothetical protein
MRAVVTVAALALLLAPTTATAQPVSYPGNPGWHPVAYICTAAAQVVRVTTNASGGVASAIVYANGASGSFDDCVVGPDGFLYVANGNKIVKIDLSETSLPTTPESPAVAELTPSSRRIRGLAFNGNVLYATTETSHVYRIDVSTGDVDPIFNLSPTGGRGLAFDEVGNLDLVSGGKLFRSNGTPYVNDYTAPLASPPAPPNPQFPVTLANAYGVGMNTCREMVVGTTNPRALKRVDATGAVSSTNITFPSNYRPLHLEVDWSNRIYMIAGSNNEGADSRLMVALPSFTNANGGAGWLTTCGSYTLSTLLELKTTGPNKIPGLLSTTAVGLAIGQSAHKLEHTFHASDTNCERAFDFGGFIYKVTLAECFDQTLKITAFKSRPADVTFSLGSEASSPTPISLSPHGGFAAELGVDASPESIPANSDPFLAQFNGFTQQAIQSPGIAKGAFHNPNDIGPGKDYTSSVLTEFWDVGLLDFGGGERERDWSKRVLFSGNVGACSLGQFETPLRGDLPLINSNSNLKVAIRKSGACNGQMRVSIARINDDGTYSPRLVKSNSGEIDNIMTVQTNKFTYSLIVLELFRELNGDLNLPEPGKIYTFLLTVHGSAAAPESITFTVTK